MAPEQTNVEVTDEFRTWWDGLDIRDQRAMAKVVNALVRRGHRLRFPHSSAIKGSRHGRLRELRVPGRPPIRVFYAFDPYRTAILLIAGHKTDACLRSRGGTHHRSHQPGGRSRGADITRGVS